MELTDLVKVALVPGSTGFLLLGLTIGLALFLRQGRTRRWGVGWLTALAVAYWILALPWTASSLESLLDSGAVPLTEATAPDGPAVIIVLGGGSETYRAGGSASSVPSETSALRALEAARVYRLLDDALVIASGGPGGESGKGEAESSVLRTILEAQGVPGELIREEPFSTTTREEALQLAEMLSGLPAGDVIVVTSPSHTRRALGAFAAAGIVATGSPGREHSDTRLAAPAYIPSERGLRDSRAALREVMALIYYRARGWLAPIEAD